MSRCRDVVIEKLDLLAAQVRIQLADGDTVQPITGDNGCVGIQRPFDAREQAELVASAGRDIAQQKAPPQTSPTTNSSTEISISPNGSGRIRSAPAAVCTTR